MKRLLWLLVFSGCCSVGHAGSVIIATTYHNDSGRLVEEKGTAVCFYTDDRGSLLLTCKHVVTSNPRSVWVRCRNDWYRCAEPILHPTEDIAVIETGIRLSPTPLSDGVAVGSNVVVEGAGPSLNHTDEALRFQGRATPDGIVNDDGLAVIGGDSGGPVYVQTSTGAVAVGGIVYGYPGQRVRARRADHRGSDAVTLYTPTSAFYSWIETQYCQNGTCPIQIRPQVIQPLGPLGFPRGNPRVIGIAEPVPQRYEPVQSEPLRPTPDPISITGPRGAAGPMGPAGPAGRDGRSVQPSDVEATVNAWLDANIDQIRGPQGEPGTPGPAGRDGIDADTSTLDARLTELEHRPFRIIISSEGKIVDDETYEPGQPVVLDLKRLRSVSGGK
jgi:hypothetical protein